MTKSRIKLLTLIRHQFAMRRRTTLHQPVSKKGTQDLYGDEEHSLQGKHEKTHAVC